MADILKAPRGAERILRWFVSADELSVVLGDLSEELQERVRTSGEARARRWYWRETARTAWIFADCGPWTLAWIVAMAGAAAAVLRWVEWTLFVVTPVAVLGDAYPATRFICGAALCGVAGLTIPFVLGRVSGWVTGHRRATAAVFAVVFTAMNVAMARSYWAPRLEVWQSLRAAWAVWFFVSYELVAVAVFVAGAIAGRRRESGAAVYRAA